MQYHKLVLLARAMDRPSAILCFNVHSMNVTGACRSAELFAVAWQQIIYLLVHGWDAPVWAPHGGTFGPLPL